jgi:hypothetical protein
MLPYPAPAGLPFPFIEPGLVIYLNQKMEVIARVRVPRPLSFVH